MSETPLRVVPLGGLGEIGKNMMALEYDGEMVVIDAGVLFPEEGMPGVDLVIPDITYLVENRHKLKAILITHGHEDHIGALPYVLPELDVPIYSSRLTHGLVSVKLRERGLLKDARLNVVEPNTPFKVGRLGVEFFRVCHSIPDAMGIALRTPLGVVVHTGDFKIDHTPADGRPSELGPLARFGDEGVLLMCSDSTYAEIEGFTPSEQVVGDALDRVISRAKGRVMIATFASLISRIQQVIDAAVRHGRKVGVVGRSMNNNVRMATNMGYLQAPPGTVMSLNDAQQLPLDEVVILATGAQGEPTSALVRIANREHQDIEIVPGDTVVISASPIPGNETLVARTLDNLVRQGATVLHSRTAMVHVHGHASREELKTVLSLVKPQYFVPVHGEYRHLAAHADLARAMGVADENAFVLEDGDVLELRSDFGRVAGAVPAGHIFVDGRHIWGMESGVLDQRRRLARNGVVVVSASVDSRTDRPVGRPAVTSSGFVELDDSKTFFQKASEKALYTLEQGLDLGQDLERTRAEVSRAVASFLYEETGRRPTVIVQIDQL